MNNFQDRVKYYYKNLKTRTAVFMKKPQAKVGSAIVGVLLLAVVIARCAAPTATQQAQSQPTAAQVAAAPTNTNPPPAPTNTTAPEPTATTAAMPEPSATTAAADNTGMVPTSLVGDMIRGGKLYDAWWTETEQDPPTDNMPLWKTQTTNTRKGSSTWRCAECHGWDYKGVDGMYASGSHMTGFKGVLADKGKKPEDILAALKGGTNPDHDFSAYLEEQDLVDLALFIANGTTDVAPLLTAEGKSTGDAVEGKTKFDEVCAGCHGPNGTSIDFAAGSKVEYLADPGNANPAQFIHRMRIGVAVWPMPSAITNKFTDKDLANVLAYVQTLPHEASVGGGALLYDKWYTVLGVNTPKDNMPLWATQTTNTRKGASTWSCRECHGIDYRGAAGEFSTGSHKTGFPGVIDVKNKSEQEITDALTGKMDPKHDFSQLLDEASIKALVHFFQKEMVDFTSYIKDGKVQGNLENGKKLYTATCAQCHGDDGKAINFHAGQDTPEYVGTVAAEQATTLMHRVMFGVPGFPMSSAVDLGFSMDQIADVSAYAQTLPTK